jgi:CheY-like chemotaxis protein
LKTWKPAVLVCDIGMPDMDGYQLIRHIRELPKRSGGRIPAVAVTAYASEVDRNRALDAGYQAHIAKPFPAERLIGTVAKLVEQNNGAASRKK